MADQGAGVFETRLLRPAKSGKDESWSFLVLPKSASDTLPRRGRTTVDGSLNGRPFQATLEPDGQLSHWLRVDEKLRLAAGAEVGDTVSVRIAPADAEPEPEPPEDLGEVLAGCPAALATWNETTTIARIDWIHWIESAKQARTRQSRVEGARDMLSSGKKRVCCFDQSGFYSKSLKAPQADG